MICRMERDRRDLSRFEHADARKNDSVSISRVSFERVFEASEINKRKVVRLLTTSQFS
jgi:hypothetical protein